MLKKLFLNDKIILILILLNAVVLFLGGYSVSDDQRWILSIVDHVITILFIIEMVVKMIEFGTGGYFKSNWNRFDFVLIVLSIPALIVFVFNLDLTDFSFLLVFRVLRVFKSFRFFKFIPDVGQLVEGIQRAFKASVFVFVGFVVYIFIIGILTFYLFRGSGSDYFSDPMISLFSTFRIFTVDGWSEIPGQIVQGLNKSGVFFTYLYFIFVVLTGGILGLSLVNSIFVDAMVSDNNEELEKKIDTLDSKVNLILTKLTENEAGEDTR